MTAANDTPVPEPTEGGSYVRHPDGTLERIEPNPAAPLIDIDIPPPATPAGAPQE